MLGQFDPEEKPTLGMGPPDAGRECLFHRLYHNIPLLPIVGDNLLNVRLQQSSLDELVDYILAKRVGMQVGALLHFLKLRQNIIGPIQPSNPESRSDYLGKCPDRDYFIVPKGFECRDAFPGKPPETLRILSRLFAV